MFYITLYPKSPFAKFTDNLIDVTVSQTFIWCFVLMAMYSATYLVTSMGNSYAQGRVSLNSAINTPFPAFLKDLLVSLSVLVIARLLEIV